MSSVQLHVTEDLVLMRQALVAAVLLASLLPQSPQSGRAVDLEAADCSQYQSRWDGYRTVYRTAHTSVPTSVGALEVQPARNGGVQVMRGSGNTYSITACIAGGAPTEEAARQAVDGVTLVTDRGRVTTTGGGEHTSVQLVIEIPNGSHVHASTGNGPISFEDVEGTFSAEASNGPIALRNVRGTVTARTQNGPISIHGGSGTFDAEASNGPVGVDLEGTRWDGHLDARTHNGPLTVTVPENFASGVEISSSSRSPWSCRRANCGASRRADDDGRSLRLGGEPVVVRISTSNGPVAVREP